jgi:hypothetical protein
VINFENGGRVPQAKEYRQPLKTRKGKEMDFSPVATRRNAANTLILDFWPA